MVQLDSKTVLISVFFFVGFFYLMSFTVLWCCGLRVCPRRHVYLASIRSVVRKAAASSIGK